MNSNKIAALGFIKRSPGYSLTLLCTSSLTALALHAVVAGVKSRSLAVPLLLQQLKGYRGITSQTGGLGARHPCSLQQQLPRRPLPGTHTARGDPHIKSTAQSSLCCSLLTKFYLFFLPVD